LKWTNISATCPVFTPLVTGIDGPMLAHKAEEEGIAVETMAGLPGTSITTLFQVRIYNNCMTCSIYSTQFDGSGTSNEAIVLYY
jgi:hypothetical protein